MNETDQLVLSLWAPFVEKINTGKPVYFCFYHDFIERIIPENLLGGKSSADLIQSTILNNSTLSNGKIYLKQESLCKRECGFSLAIVYVCQQVLAVEDMSNDSGGLSANAYFPRLRKAISSRLTEKSSNPFLFKEFERIWKTLEKEVLELSGGNFDCVTFRFGLESGLNKARYFPFSQGLLSHEDLEIVCLKVGLKKLRSSSKDRVYNHAIVYARNLSRRAQKLMNIYYLRENICDQIVTFAKSVDVEKIEDLIHVEEKIKEHEIIVFKESEDWFSESFQSFLREKSSGEKIFDSDFISRAIRNCKLRNGYILFPLSVSGDAWVKYDSLIEILPGDSFLLAGTAEDIIKAANAILTISGSKSFFSKDFVRYDFYGLKISELTLPMDSINGVIAKSGRFVGPSEFRSNSKFNWVGGVCLDYRSNKYLRGHLPNGLMHRNSILDMSSVTSINGHFISFSSFEDSIRNAEFDLTVDFVFEKEIKAKLIVGVSRSEARRIGIKLNSSGKLDLSANFVDGEDAFITGFYSNKPLKKIGYTSTVIANILVALSTSDFDCVNLANNEVDLIIDGIRASHVSKEVRQVASQLLVSSPRLPSNLLHQLLVS